MEAIDPNVPVAAVAGDKELGGSSGLDQGVTIKDITTGPQEHVGMTVSGEVEEGARTPHVFTVGDRHLLVISVEPRPEVFVEATAYVTGEVRMFNLEEVERELGVDLDDAMMRAFEGQPFILADSVELLT